MPDTNKLVEVEGISDKITARRVARALLRRVPYFGNSSALFLVQAGFKVKFDEEGETALRLPKFGNYDRSKNLFDQREVLFRALIAWALKVRVIDPRRNFIDVGAANGDSALSWSQLVGGTIYAIDPSAGNIDYLNSVARTNGLTNIDAFVMAIGDSEGLLYPFSDVNHTYFTEQPMTRYGAKHPVGASSFDRLHQVGRIENVGFLHLDVEGMELMALRGSLEMLKADRPIVAFESHITIDDIDAIFAVLHSVGYVIYMINEVTCGGRPDCVNFLAFPSAPSIELWNEVQPKGQYFKAMIGGNLIPVE